MKKLSVGICLTMLAMATTAQAGHRKHHPHNLFVKMKKGQTLVKSPLIHKSRRLFGNLYLVKTKDAAALELALEGQTGIDYIQKDFFGIKRLMPKLEKLEKSKKNNSGVIVDVEAFNDPDVSKLWAFNKIGMDVHAAYSILPVRPSEKIIVAIVDTGVDHDHVDLKDVMWTNEKEIAGNGIDDDNNGYIDDLHGINTLVRDGNGNATMDTMASHWHGTHVAGTIGATQNNGKGIAGVASNVEIMAIRTVPDDADELDSDIVEGFLYAAKMGARLINCSFGKDNNEGGMVVRDTINEIAKSGVLVVAAAGNDYGNNNDVNLKFPASFDSPNLLVVASTAEAGSLSNFTNLGAKTVDVAAPGSNIHSTINGNQYGMASGTSMATPNTVGAAALVLQFYPQLSPAQLKAVLMGTVTPVASYAGRLVTGGRINLKAALEKASQL